MNVSSMEFWLGFGLLLIASELLVPGLVAIFIGIGALTVAMVLHFGFAQNILEQLIVWFFSSTLYIFSLRLLVMRFYPTDTNKGEIDEDQFVVGQTAEVVATIGVGQRGRIRFGDSTWQAYSEENHDIMVGEEVRVLKRDNITWLVEKSAKGEK